jgi:hypothetical protein
MALAIKAMSVCALLTAAMPLAAQSTVVTTPAPTGANRRSSSLPRQVDVPGYGTVLVVPVQPKDPRNPRQRCVDEEMAREGGSPSQLAMGTIDLKCSQR